MVHLVGFTIETLHVFSDCLQANEVDYKLITYFDP